MLLIRNKKDEFEYELPKYYVYLELITQDILIRAYNFESPNHNRSQYQTAISKVLPILGREMTSKEIYAIYLTIPDMLEKGNELNNVNSIILDGTGGFSKSDKFEYEDSPTIRLDYCRARQANNPSGHEWSIVYAVLTLSIVAVELLEKVLDVGDVIHLIEGESGTKAIGHPQNVDDPSFALEAALTAENIKSIEKPKKERSDGGKALRSKKTQLKISIQEFVCTSNYPSSDANTHIARDFLKRFRHLVDDALEYDEFEQIDQLARWVGPARKKIS